MVVAFPQKKIGYLKNYGDVWFDERAITNILCLKNVKQKYRVTYDSTTDGVFTVHKPGQQPHFVMHNFWYHDNVDHPCALQNATVGLACAR